jgi:hypothetical protein
MGIIFHAFSIEGPREAFIGGVIGVFVTLTLGQVSRLLHKRAQTERRRHHAEVMAAHKRTHDHLGIGGRP